MATAKLRERVDKIKGKLKKQASPEKPEKGNGKTDPATERLLKLVEREFSNLFLVIGDQNVPQAILSKHPAATEQDVERYAQERIDGALEVKSVHEIALADLHSPKTRQWFAHRKQNNLWGSENVWLSNFARKYSYLPRHQVRPSMGVLKQWHEKKQAEELGARIAAHSDAFEHNRRVVDAELQQLLKEHEELEKRIYACRERIRLKGPNR